MLFVFLTEMLWTRWRMYMKRILRWAIPPACSRKYQRPFVTWKSCAQRSIRMRYKVKVWGMLKKGSTLVKLITCSATKSSIIEDLVRSLYLCSRPGCLRWRENRAPEETEDPAQTITSTLPKAEKGKLLPQSHTETSLRGQLQLKDELNFLSHEARLVKCMLNVSSYKKKCFLIFDLKSKFMVISFLIFLVLLFSYYIIMF